MKKIDSITLEIIGNQLLSVAEEMGVTLIKTSYSTNIKERKDCSTAIFDSKGNIIAQAEHIPMHLGSMLGVVTEILKKYPREHIYPGDMFITNDPYSGGGTHLPDITVVAPVFTNGELAAFVANLAHHADVGGKVPGSTSGDATSVFQEGIRIPLIKICSKGNILNDVLEFIQLNSRTPYDRLGDLRAQIASNSVGVKRLANLIRSHGIEKFKSCSESLLDYAESMIKSGIKRIPDGEYSFIDYLDDDGINLDNPIPIQVKIKINDDHAYLDFTGSSPQVKGPVNVTLNGLLTTVFYCFKALIGPKIFSNQGIFRALTVHAPEKSIVNCLAPAAIGERIDTCQRVVDVIFGAMAKAIPDKVIAACNSAVTTATFSGINPKSNDFYVYLETIAGGSGASQNSDGLSGVQVHMTNTSNLSVEALEQEFPLLIEKYQLCKDSGGAGLYRGGLGIEREIMVLHDNVTFSGLADRHKHAPWGLNGGMPGSTGTFWVKRNEEEPEKLISKVSDVHLNTGDKISVCTPGAGGYGNPLLRDPLKVLQDVHEGKVSIEAAKNLYKVILSEDGQSINEEETFKARNTPI
ncbi:hydantoinase B/oxoprolinase family protein [Heyndrickxia coagulans]|jgi:N-methylhydantoinase B|uniref:hydantoinase B/oxoprolinase family protein n=1 Tax=Heyndrickxia TaxID=2837504 RepID=UPI0021B19AB6|nr:hydantoinase B/oxoprolinase family protein [Heyndrickxia coagulans]UXC22781.1 hydantoinase B/oxoprolinase family protein [Heyndrickxia coagulans]